MEKILCFHVTNTYKPHRSLSTFNNFFIKDKINNITNFFTQINLRCYLMSRYHGRNREYEATTNRDIALVNKACDFVKEEHSVPPNWRQDLNRNMVRTEDGRWVLDHRPQVVDIHHEDIEPHLQQIGILSPNK
jgi:hypothetical protein